MTWTEKYRPRKLNEVVGHGEIKAKLIEFIKNFNQQKKKALMLWGAAGSGKTALAYALASELALELIELNASDFRNKQKIHEILGNALKQHSLFTKGKLILVDELDGIAGTKDRGGLQELMRLIKEAAWPIVLIANDVWQDKLRPLRSKTKLIELKALDKASVIALLKKICKKEKLNIQHDALEVLATITQGDARAAINDLQALQALSFISKGKKTITKTDAVSLCTEGREKNESIFNAIRLIFKSKSALGAFDNINLKADDFFLWLDENLPLEYKGKELAAAYDKLSRADVFRGRIRKQQHWRFLSYIMELITEGVASVKSQAKQDFTSYKPPSRILKIWIAKQKNAKKKAIAEKLAKISHCSKKQAFKEMPYIKMVFQKNRQIEQFATELKLEPEELDYFTNI